MHGIIGITSLSSEFTPEYAAIRTLEVEGPVFEGGAFGDVYDLVAVDGVPPPTPQIVKVLRDNGYDSARRGFETIEKLQHKVVECNRDRRAAGEPPLQSLPALRALPQFSFRGRMGGEAVFGYSADRLDTAGYVPLSHVLDPDEDPAPRARYASELTLGDRLLLAYELAEGMYALQALSYIHGDINPPNLFVNVDECHVALIDFDSGAVTDDPDEIPTTFGKRTDGEWVAPEILDQLLAPRQGPPMVRVDRSTDDWAVTVGIHYLLFLCGPFFILKRSSSKSIRDYVTRLGWPGFDPADPLFTSGIAPNHASYTAMLAQLPPGVTRRMSDALNGGTLQPGRRTRPYQWMLELRGALLLFQAEPEVTVEGCPVRLTWRVAGSGRVHIDGGIGDVDEAGTREVLPAGDIVYTLTAEARGGRRSTASVAVRVVKLKVLLFQAEPEVTVEGRPVRLTWVVAGSRRVSIDGGVGPVGEAGTCKVLPTAGTVYTLTAEAEGGRRATASVAVPVMPIPHLESVLVPAPDLSHTVILRNLRLSAPAIRLDAPAIQLAAPSLSLPLSVNLEVRFAGASPVGALPVLPAPPARAIPPSGWALMDWLPRAGHVFNHLYERLKSELGNRFGGTP
jgi:hypothetical protein